MKFTASRLDHEFSDESGYRFTVTAVLDPEYGWSASVEMASHGRKTSDAAIEALGTSAKEFLRQLKARKPGAEGDK